MFPACGEKTLTEISVLQEQMAFVARRADQLGDSSSNARKSPDTAEAEFDDEREDAYTDKQWRRIELVPHGSSWTERCNQLAQQISKCCQQNMLVDSGQSL